MEACSTEGFETTNFRGNLLTCVAISAVSQRFEGTGHLFIAGDFTFGKIWGWSLAFEQIKGVEREQAAVPFGAVIGGVGVARSRARSHEAP